MRKLLYFFIASLLSVILFSAGTISAAQEGLPAKFTVVLPLKPVAIDEDDSKEMTRLVIRKLALYTMYTVSLEETLERLEENDCDDEDTWDESECMMKIASHPDAGFITSGSLALSGDTITVKVHLFEKNVKGLAGLWTRTYQSVGSVDRAKLSIPSRIAEDIVLTFKQARSVVQDSGSAPALLPESSDGRAYEIRKPEDNGIVKGPTIGIHGLFALGEVEKGQSPVSGYGMFLYPTTPRSHLRIKAGIPTTLFESTGRVITKEMEDIQLCAEHEWGWTHIGVSAGIVYTILSEFTGTFKPLGSLSSFTTARYDVHHSFNVSVSLRGGKPSSCFHGRITFPLAIAMEDGMGNGVFEYSVFGVFGREKTKAGIGHFAYFKRRKPTSLTNGDTTITLKEYETELGDINGKTVEFYGCLPALKFAHLFGDHFVANVTLELGGTIIPRFTRQMWWRPSAGIDFVYSFGKLDGPSVMDGTF
jgi:hypothetical protein